MLKKFLNKPALSLDYSYIERSLTKEEHWKHPFTLLLQEGNVKLKEENFSSNKDSMFLGLKFVRGISEIVFRFIQEDVILVVLFKRIKKECGLKSSFLDFAWFLDMVAKKESQLNRIIGKVQKLKKDGYGDISTERMVKFYLKHLNGSICDVKGEPLVNIGKPKGVWLYLDLKNYKPLKRRRK
ncbi:hypothetical protein [Desulfothermus sp.]